MKKHNKDIILEACQVCLTYSMDTSYYQLLKACNDGALGT